MILKRLILVLLAAFLVMGCVGAVSAEGEPIIHSFTANPTDVNVNSLVTFTFDVENATTLTLKYSANGGDNDVSGQTSSQTTYSTPGEYIATLTATNSSGATVTRSSETIVVTEPVIPLKASFTTDKSSGVAPLTVQFTNTSAGSPSSYIWTFGSAGNTTEKDPTFTFNAPGIYQVKLNVSDGTTYDECTQTITVNPRVITNVVISSLIAPESGNSPDYSASVSSTPNGNVNSIPVVTWHYASNGTAVTGNFANGTIYKAIVTIEATNDYNFTSNTGFEVTGLPASSISRVLESNNQVVNVTCIYPATDAGIKDISSISITGVTLPVGGATKNKSKPTVSSTPSGSVESISNITWKNDYDGSTDGTLFKYETVYKAIMTVEAKSGYRFTSGSAATLNGYDAVLVPTNSGTSATITYTCPKTAAEGKILPAITTFTVNPTSGMSPLKVRFTVATTNATTVTLNFGDGSTPTSIKNGYVEHVYSTAGSFYPILTATNTNSSVTETRSILVQAPLATSTPTPTSTPAAASLTAMSLGAVNIPAPLDVIKEFMHLFYSIFDPASYQFA